MFIDASAIVAMIAREPDHEELRQRLKRHRSRTMSAIVVYEASLALARISRIPPTDALDLVQKFKRIYAVKPVSIELRHADAAIHAFQQYGPGRGHKAQLNFGDCFSYACAKLLNVPLLFKGNDFSHTDIQPA